MYVFLIVAHLCIALAIIAVVLLQRSEGSSLGMSDAQAFGARRTAAHPLARVTAVLAFLFMLTSIGLTMIAQHQDRPTSILDKMPAKSTPAAPEAAPKAEEPKAPAAPSVPMDK